MKELSVTLRPMLLRDVEAGMRLSTAEEWNQTEKDWKFLIENPHNICVAAESHDTVIGTTAAINYSNQVAWIGMMLVDKAFRGMGVSKLLLGNILEKLSSYKSIKLDATPAGREIYKKFGFRDEYLIIRMTSSSAHNYFPIIDNRSDFVESIRSEHTKKIIKFDEVVFGANRISLIKHLIKEYPRAALVLRSENNIVAFALGRNGHKYHHIGPVIAETIDDAKILISKALKDLGDQPVAVDVLNDKNELINWLQSIGFTKQREFVRMYKNENCFAGIINKYYLISGPELG